MTLGKSASDTPLSELIAELIASDSPENKARFLALFRTSQVGVMASGVPSDVAGESVSTSENPVGVGLTRHAGGRPMVLAFADPEAFAARFGWRFNAAMSGEALLPVVLHNPECAGVLVNSALVKMSVVIDRITIQSQVRPTTETSSTKP